MKNQKLKNPLEIEPDKWNKKCDICGRSSVVLYPPSFETNYLTICEDCKRLLGLSEKK